MWWVQNLSERICGRAGLTESERLRDGQSAPTGQFWHIQYVDNLHVFGHNKKEVEDRFWSAVDGLRQAGLTVHEIEIGDSHAKMLGWEVSTSSRLRPTPQTIWRIRVAIREILKRGRASGQQLERLLGHMTFVSLCRREGLSVLGEIYTFCKRHYRVVTPLWKSVRRELYKWDAISPLLFCDLSSPWSNTLLAVDASEWGLGVTSSSTTTSDIVALGACFEKWRFKDDMAKDPRLFVLAEEDRLCSMQNNTGGKGDVQELEPTTSSFSTAPFSSVNRKWQVIGRHQWQEVQSMPVLEARAALHAIRHAVRSKSGFGMRHVILTDSMTAAVAYDKGRASSYKLRRVLEQASALTLASGSMFRMRWIPSEWNPADRPSRRVNRNNFLGMIHRQLGIPVSWPKEKKRSRENLSVLPQKRSLPNPYSKSCSRQQELPPEAPLTWDMEIEEDKPSVKKARRSNRRIEGRVLNPSDSLRKNSVGPETLANYQKHWGAFLRWCRVKASDITNMASLDSQVTAYLEFLYLEGEDLSAANYLVASVMFHVPGCKGLSTLPKAQQSMKGWRRLCPPRSRMPIPLEAIALLAESATHQKLPQIALVLLLTFFLYLRPGEAFKLRVQDIVRPVKRAGKGYKFFSVLLHPTEQDIPSKTLQWDEMLTLDLAVRNFLGPALVQTLELDHRPKQSRAFTVTLDQVNEFMKRLPKMFQ